MDLPNSGKANCAFSSSSSGESGAELIEDKELSSSNDVEGIEDAVMEDIGSRYCMSGDRSLSLETSMRLVKSSIRSLLVISITSGFFLNLLDLVAFGEVAFFGTINGTIKLWAIGPFVGVISLEGGKFDCLMNTGRPSSGEAWTFLDRRSVALFVRGVSGALKAVPGVSSLILSTIDTLVT